MRSLGKNAVFNVLYKCLNVVFPLITSAYVSRVLMPVGVGKIYSAQNIVSYFVIIAALGLPTYGVKKIAECIGDRKRCSKTFSELFCINFVSTLICSLLYVLLITQFGFLKEKLLLSLVVGIQLFANIFNVDWFYQGVEEYKYIMLRSLLVKALALVAVFVFVKEKNDFIVYALISALSLVANYFFNILNLKKYVDFIFKGLDIIVHLKPVFILLAASIAIEIYTLADTTMLNVLKGDEIVGFYSSALKIISIIRTLVTAICAVFLPRMSYMYSHGEKAEFKKLANKGIAVLLTLSMPVAVGLFLVADNSILIVFGKEFLPAVPTLKILAISVITVALSNFTGYQILVTVGKEKKVFISTLIGAVTNIILNWFLIPLYDQNGAAIASILTEGLIAVYQFICVKKLLNIKIRIKSLLKIIIPLISMGIVVIALKSILNSVSLQTVFSVGLGAITYFIMAYLIRNPIVVQASEILTKKFKGAK